YPLALGHALVTRPDHPTESPYGDSSPPGLGREEAPVRHHVTCDGVRDVVGGEGKVHDFQQHLSGMQIGLGRRYPLALAQVVTLDQKIERLPLLCVRRPGHRRAGRCCVPLPKVIESMSPGERTICRCHRPRGTTHAEPARNSMTCSPSSTSSTTSMAPDRRYRTSSPEGCFSHARASCVRW